MNNQQKIDEQIELQLEKDNTTIKEQILNLQNTIKKLKDDMLNSKEKQSINNLFLTNNTLN